MGAAVYSKAKNALDKYNALQIMKALDKKNVVLSREDVQQLKSLIAEFDSAMRQNKGVLAKKIAKDVQELAGKSKVAEGDVVNINRGGHNAFRDKNDWLDKRDYVQQQLLDPRQRDNYPELKQRLLDINSAGRKLGYTK
jgi:hypothetical protein